MRTSVTLRLRCSIAWACAEMCGASSSSTAHARITSAAESHQRRQRLVTSFSGAARCEASWANICQDSWPTSRATSGPSPAIQRATATVETVPTRVKRSSTTGSSWQADSLVRLSMPSTTSSVRALSAWPRLRSASG